MRDRLSPEEREGKSRLIWDNLLSLPEVTRSATVLLYADHFTEVMTRGLITRLLDAQVRVGLPVVLSDSPHLLLREVSAVEQLVKGAFGIAAPPETATCIPYAEVDLVALPGVAFDPDCWRVGYGGGFYDRLLAQSSAFSVGLSFECQILPKIPVECHDEQLDAIVTERRIIRARELEVESVH